MMEGGKRARAGVTQRGQCAGKQHQCVCVFSRCSEGREIHFFKPQVICECSTTPARETAFRRTVSEGCPNLGNTSTTDTLQHRAFPNETACVHRRAKQTRRRARRRTNQTCTKPRKPAPRTTPESAVLLFRGGRRPGAPAGAHDRWEAVLGEPGRGEWDVCARRSPGKWCVTL